MRKIIVLDNPPADGGFVNFRVLFWIPAKTPKPTTVGSIWAKASTGPEVAAILAGTIIEEQHTFSIPNSWVTDMPSIAKFLQDAYNARVNYLNALPDQQQFTDFVFDNAWVKVP